MGETMQSKVFGVNTMYLKATLICTTKDAHIVSEHIHTGSQSIDSVISKNNSALTVRTYSRGSHISRIGSRNSKGADAEVLSRIDSFRLNDVKNKQYLYAWLDPADFDQLASGVFNEDLRIWLKRYPILS